MSEQKYCMKCIVSGKVQGVWFRASTREVALELGLHGWAKNLSDGRVEVLACGEARHIQALMSWLEHGPEHAEVKQVVSDKIAWQECDDFLIY